MTPAPFNSLPDDPVPPARAFWLRAEDGVRLRAGYWPAAAPRGTILLMQGRTEYLEKYNPCATELNQAGFDVLSLDWRGQGLSDRLIDNPRPSHVPDFADYQRDVIELVVAAEELDLPRPWHLLAHSMGGAIGLAALAEGLPVASAAFSAPMWGLHLSPILRRASPFLTSVGRRMGWGLGYVPGSGNDRPYVVDAAFHDNLLTSCGQQWARLLSQATAWPEIGIGGVTFDWLHAALAECTRLATLPPPDLPALIGLGSREAVICASAAHRHTAAWPGARLLILDGARHELMMEHEANRQQFRDAVIALFETTG